MFSPEFFPLNMVFGKFPENGINVYIRHLNIGFPQYFKARPGPTLALGLTLRREEEIIGRIVEIFEKKRRK